MLKGTENIDKIINQSLIMIVQTGITSTPSGVKTLTGSGLHWLSLGGLIIEIVVHLLLQWSYIISKHLS